MRSPAIVALARMAPSHPVPIVAIDGGMISAIGSPRRVTMIGAPVRRTRSRTERQVALNSEIGIVSTGFPVMK